MLANVNLFGAGSFEGTPHPQAILIVEISRRIRGWLEVNHKFLPDLKSGKKWLVGFGWDQNILPDGKYPTAVHILFYLSDH